MEERFCRNIPAITEEDQEKLRKSHVCVVGCGGLGGYLAEFLARAGVGSFTVIDADCFEPSNLNRQCLATVETLGTPKTAAAAKRIRSIDPAVTVYEEAVFLNETNVERLIRGADLVMDALDNVSSRKILFNACDQSGIPFIHGAVRGWNAQICVCLPGDAVLEKLYPDSAGVHERDDRDDPADKTCLSFTPALCAAIQSAQAIRLLTGNDAPLQSRLLLTDLRDMEFFTVDL